VRKVIVIKTTFENPCVNCDQNEELRMGELGPLFHHLNLGPVDMTEFNPDIIQADIRVRRLTYCGPK